jgi:cytochrome c553
MQKAMEGWSDKDLEAVADYVSQLRVVTPSPR